MSDDKTNNTPADNTPDENKLRPIDDKLIDNSIGRIFEMLADELERDRIERNKPAEYFNEITGKFEQCTVGTKPIIEAAFAKIREKEKREKENREPHPVVSALLSEAGQIPPELIRPLCGGGHVFSDADREAFKAALMRGLKGE
jgi:hypothetical protein